MEHETVWVVATKNTEYAYLHTYCANQGDSILPLNSVEQFPVAIVVNRKTGRYQGWSNMMDRAATYISFTDFVVSDLTNRTSR